MGEYDFKKDLSTANETEKEIADFLETKYKVKVLEFNDTNEYDLLVKKESGEMVTFEIKEDFLCGETGNTVVEYECRGKPSGIAVTKADYYIYKMHTKQGIRYIFHKTKDIIKMIDDEKYIRVVNGGDKNSNSMNYLFRYKAFVSTGNIIAPWRATKNVV